MPAWGTTSTPARWGITLTDFNPRARVGHDNSRPLSVVVSIISIHVPAWGTTSVGVLDGDGQEISIHVPAWGTTSQDVGRFTTFYFNPRARVGHDSSVVTFSVTDIISIHVPAWGTTIRSEVHGPDADFNPRARVGHDPVARSSSSPKRFQSTCPRGARHGFLRQRCDAGDISIHVPAWGTTYKVLDQAFKKLISIHVPAWGTTSSTRPGMTGCRFQSTCPRGARPGGPGTACRGRHFNPRARVGHDMGSLPSAPPARFQSTCPRGARRL